MPYHVLKSDRTTIHVWLEVSQELRHLILLGLELCGVIERRSVVVESLARTCQH